MGKKLVILLMLFALLGAVLPSARLCRAVGRGGGCRRNGCCKR